MCALRRTMKRFCWRLTLLGEALTLATLTAPVAVRAQTPTVFGSLFNFDVYNDTGEIAHGFEIELDGSPAPVAFFPDRYGLPSVTPFAGGYYVRYESTWDPITEQFATGTPPLTGPITRTTAEPCIPMNVPLSSNPAPCDHNGVRFDPANISQMSIVQPTNVVYRWLIADPQHPGQLIPSGSAVSIPAPIWTVQPPAQAGAAPIVAAEIHPPPPPHPEQQKGDAQWVKIYKTELPRDVALDELTTDNPAVVPEDASQAEIEWKLLQHNPHSPNSGALKTQAHLGGGSHTVIRRYEFYKYAGAYDPVDHGAMCGGDGSCNAPLDGELGDYIGAQMAALNLAGTAPGTPLASATPAATSCVGDCNHNGVVDVNELLTMVNIALGDTALSACTAGDGDDNGEISVNEILAAVSSALNGCATPPTPTPVTHTVLVGPDGTFTFRPPDLSIHVGDTVMWSWESSGHNVVSGSDCTADKQFCSPNDSSCDRARLSSHGTVYNHTFTAVGTYPYFCSQHCSFGMAGTITVE
ncbi:MAG TPA: plastocyanin/azurin family copper-binding protein [Candidatus Margulisiibacteriota bacterium]|nr:plastocyanin/azurin family copper-binding protein [Candidatus Margulisiibacteriota bacterium]